jgi:hypothetical protein
VQSAGAFIFDPRHPQMAAAGGSVSVNVHSAAGWVVGQQQRLVAPITSGESALGTGACKRSSIERFGAVRNVDDRRADLRQQGVGALTAPTSQNVGDAAGTAPSPWWPAGCRPRLALRGSDHGRRRVEAGH